MIGPVFLWLAARPVPEPGSTPFCAETNSSPTAQVRCDAASLGVPCTNCVAFQIECRIPTPKRKKNQNASGQTGKDSDRCVHLPVPKALRIGCWSLTFYGTLISTGHMHLSILSLSFADNLPYPATEATAMNDHRSAPSAPAPITASLLQSPTRPKVSLRQL